MSILNRTNPLNICTKKGFIQHSSYSRITQKDIYESLWRCRDFELTNLWQRSIFLTAFIVLIITGYCYTINEAIKIIPFKKEDNLQQFIIYLFVAFFISMIGIFFSALWIMMGKGSKAWYERYEKALYNIERDPEVSDACFLEDKNMMHGSLVSGDKKITKCLFSNSGGPYSVSKINIAIGQLLLGFGIVCFLSNLLIIKSVLCSYSEIKEKGIGCIFLNSNYNNSILLFVIVFLFLFCIFICYNCKSPTLESKVIKRNKRVIFNFFNKKICVIIFNK